ncbi:MAG TPA: hypothetical protein PKC55_08970 [Dysgonomonas sp.]|uniref:hypothetical protein n=1 Tax=Dysgonomonas sp. TaxID=1891233 RepID=UPI002CE5FB4E|nr:hypothetical protein [Dysgonomonas sp.]HML64945.1 hypothetical protein [Dysgonomonas sp.]
MKHVYISFFYTWLIVHTGLDGSNMQIKKMVANANISLQVLKSAREKLKNAQLISFVTRGGFRVKTKYQILEPNSTPKLSSYNINTKEKNNNTNTYGKKKGFIHSGSDFD